MIILQNETPFVWKCCVESEKMEGNIYAVIFNDVGVICLSFIHVEFY